MQEPIVKKCPICGESTVDGECYSCGFVFPDEEKLSAPYDLDPSNDLFGEAAIESDLPAMEALNTDTAMQSVEMPELSELSQAYAAVKATSYQAPNIKVRTAAAGTPAVQPNLQPIINSTPAPMQAVQNPQPSYPPVYQTADPLTRFVKAVSDFVTAHWWQFLVTLIAPSTGLLFSCYYFMVFRQRSRNAGHIVLAVLFMLMSILLLANGVDIFGIDYYIRYLLSD